MRVKSLNGLLTVLLLTSIIASLLVGLAVAKPVGKNPSWGNWPAGTLWGARLLMENNTSGAAFFGAKTGSEHVYNAPVPPFPPYIWMVFRQTVDQAEITRTEPAAPQSYTWYVKMLYNNSGTGDNVDAKIWVELENADTLFIPQDHSVILENTWLGSLNMRLYENLDTGYPVNLVDIGSGGATRYATLYVDNAVNVENIENLSPLVGAYGDPVSLKVCVKNTGRVTDNYAVSQVGGPDAWIQLAPDTYGYVNVDATLPAGNNVPLYIQATGAYATDVDYVLATGEQPIVFQAYPSGYASDTAAGIAPWVVYDNTDGPGPDNAPIMVARKIGGGAVVAASWDGGASYYGSGSYPSTINMDILFDITFQWMVPGADAILWYGGDNIYSGYKVTDADVKKLLDNLRNGAVPSGNTYTIDNGELLRLDNLELYPTYDILVINQQQLYGPNGAIGGNPEVLWDNELDNIRNWVASGKGVIVMEVSDYLNYCYNRVSNRILDNLGFGWWFQHDTINDATHNDLATSYKPLVVRAVGNEIGDNYASQAGVENILAYKCPTLIQRPTLGVNLTVSPSENTGENGMTVTFDVTVTNNDNCWDNFQLTFDNDNAWTTTLLPSYLVLNPSASSSATLSVSIPADAANGSVDHITVKATSFWDNTVSDNDTCTARCLVGRVELLDENDNLVNLYNTIQSAIDNAFPRYTVLVHPGTFNENIIVDVDNLKIRSTDGAEVTIIDVGGAENGVKIVADGVTFGGFTVTNGGLGIQLWYSNNNLIENNIAENNTWVGIELYFSDNNRIENNIAENNDYGIELGYSDINIVSNNTAGNNDYGIHLYDSYNNLIENNTCENNITGTYGIGISIMFSSNNNLIENNICVNNNYGIYLNESDNNRIENNTANINSDGIYLYNSNNNTLDNNTCDGNYIGIYLNYSNNNILIYNTMTGNGYGFYVWESNNNQIDNNIILATSYSNYGSCPFLYTWNGDSYTFVADLAGNGILAVPSGDGFRSPRPEDYAKIEGSQFQLKDGIYPMQITQEYDEISYVDELSLITIDHSPDVDVYLGLLRTEIGKIYTVSKTPSSPISCVEEDGSDCLPQVLSKDGIYTEATETKIDIVELDFGDLSGAEEIKLILSGYTEWIPGTSGISRVRGEFIQVKDGDGNWVSVFENNQLNNPAAMPRTYVINLTGKFLTDDYSVRIGFGASVKWDYIAVDTTPQQAVITNILPLVSADLHYRGYSEFKGTPRLPNYEDVSAIPPAGFSDPAGNFTRFGDVLPLLTETDDKFVIMHHGDEISLEFDYNPISEGMERDFILHTWDYYKNHYYKTGLTVDPLPFSNMSTYPYPDNESYPSDAEHLAYLSEWNTREYVGGEGAGISLPYSDNNTVFGNTIIGNSSSTGLNLDHETNTRILNNTISNTSTGIYIYFSTNCIIDNNIVENNSNHGIYLYYSNINNLNNNTCENNDFYGIYLYDSDNNRIENNTCGNNGGDGIHLEYSETNTISNNTCENNYWWGIMLNPSSNNTLDNNVCENNTRGIWLNASSNNNTLTNNTCSNNDWDGIRLENSNNNNLNNNTVENNDIGINLNESDNNLVSNNICKGGVEGIVLTTSDNNILSNNTCGPNMSGIWLDTASNNTLENNRCENNIIGIDLENSNNNNLNNNTCKNGINYGIYLRESSNNNNLNNNTCENNNYGIYVEGNCSITIVGNTVENNSNTGIVFEGVTSIYGNSIVTIENNPSISNNANGGIYFLGDIYENSEVKIIGNKIENNGMFLCGILFVGGIYGNSRVMISGNTIDNNVYGIYFDDTIYGNSMVGIYGNKIENNEQDGIYFDDDIYDNSEITIAGNTIGNNGDYGIDFNWGIYGNSEIGIYGNTIENNWDEGLDFDYIYENSMIWIYGNTVNNNGYRGIDFDDEIYGNSMVMIMGNTINNKDDEGIYFYEVYGNSVVWIDNNSISNNGDEYNPGIYFEDGTYENSMVGITRNTIANNGHGIEIDGGIYAPVIIAFNDIENNVNVDSGVHIGYEVDSRGLMVSFNNIVGNSPDSWNYGVYNGDGIDNLNALYNWWGHASGPGGEGPGTGDNVSWIVDYRPWIPSPFEDVVIGSGGGYISEGHNENIEPELTDLDLAPIPESVIVTFDSSENGFLMITMFDAIGGAPIPDGLAAAMFIDISAIPKNTAENIKITVHYTGGDVAGMDESSLKLYYWSRESEDWQLCDNVIVDTANNTITGYISHLTPFGIFGVPLPPEALPTAGVSVSVSPFVASAIPGESLSYTVTVMNTGEATDTFDLSISGAAAWSPSISATSLTLDEGTSEGVTLTVTVPSWAAVGTTTTITVTATSRADPSVSSATSCRAIASAVPAGPGETPPERFPWGIILTIAGATIIIILALIFIFYR